MVVVVIIAPVWAADPAESQKIRATVTPKLISVELSEASISYGTLVLGTSDQSPEGDPVITATNNGTVEEDFSIKGSNALLQGEGAHTWTLEDSPGDSDYTHEFGIGSSPSSYGPLDTSGKTLAEDLDPKTGSEDFKLRISLPTSMQGGADDYGEYELFVTITATEHL